MSYAAYSNFLADIQSPKEIQPITIATATSVAGRWYDLWVPTQPAGVAPTTAAAPTSATLGTLGQQDGTNLTVIAARMNALNQGVYLLIDRLSHNGGMNATSTGAQTTNLPTAALTRYTTGAGVMLGVSIYTQIGSTATTITCSYTNQAGTSGRTSPLVVFGGTGFREANRMILIPLASGDTGVRAVANSTIAASTTTVGAFGYTLFAPLAVIIVDEANGVSICDLVTGKWGGGLPTIQTGAALCFLGLSTSTNLMAGGTLLFAES